MTVALHAQQPPTTIPIDSDEIAGVVTSAHGPEAGVWVIAETSDFQTRYEKIVVTDDRGQYLLPQLPKANYQLWVRGYGLADSPKVSAKRGMHVNLTAVVAPNDAVAAKVYPAIYWFSMMHLPAKTELAGLQGGMDRYLAIMKSDACVGCHQLGDAYTRTLPSNLGTFPSSKDAWIRRMESGQVGEQMTGLAGGTLLGLPYKYLSEWSDRIAAGELPKYKPERPTGLERNVVATVRDWASPSTYLHDLTSTDWRHPTVNANGPLYGSPELSTDDFPILDPVKNVATTFHVPVRDPDTPIAAPHVFAPSPAWGSQAIWDSRANSHNPIMDQDGRVWYTAVVRASKNEPAFCKKGSDNPSAKLFPLTSSGRQVGLYDPKTKKYTFIDTCFSTHHLRFAEDANNTLWFSNDRNSQLAGAVGWINTKMYEETGDAEKSQGWTALVLDTNGNGKRDAYVEPDQPVNPKLDKRIVSDFYAIMPNPADGSIWGATRTYPDRPEQIAALVRLNLGPNPPETTLAEVYNVPLPGFGIRGADIDRNGVVWVSLASGHLGEFDRRKCKGPLNGPKATGNQCPEGWTFHKFPGPGFPELPKFSAESSYYTFVDQQNTLGLGANVPIATADLFDGVHVFYQGKFITMRVPYPLGFFSKGLEGRIDDPNAGWKGRGLWVTSGDRTPWHKEGGKGTKPLVVHFQMRPNPLAK
ncbi:MAG: carboxypeptidase-like regulatory domain-containing protein [Bryobacteraceae bacterium]